MRGLIWLVLLFSVAVVAATALGRNDGLVSLYWSGWRTDLSLNLFLLLLLAGGAILYGAVQAMQRAISLPQKASQWRALRRERAAQAALLAAVCDLHAARYGRAKRAAERALALQSAVEELEGAQDFKAMAHLLIAQSAQRLQDRPAREQHLALAMQSAEQPVLGNSPSSSLQEGLQLMRADWALEDRQPEQALAALGALSAGASRRTQALRLRMQAHRAAREPIAALRVARLLANHHGFTPTVANSLTKALAIEALEGARDSAQLQRLWAQLEAQDQAQPDVAARAAMLAASLGVPQLGLQWLRPIWARVNELEAPEQVALSVALMDTRSALASAWLPTLEGALNSPTVQPSVALAVGLAFAQLGLYGKARVQLEAALARAQDVAGPASAGLARIKRAAWRCLAVMAAQESDLERAQACHQQAASVPG